MGTTYKTSGPQNGVSPAFNMEAADFSEEDHVFANPVRALNCDADGVLYVDAVGLGVNVPVAVVFGSNNPICATRIYNAGSDAIGVVGLS